MHHTEGPYELDLGGGVRLHKASPLPKTRISKDIMNAMMKEIIHAVELSFQTLAVSGAADEIANWKQLAKAIAETSVIGESLTLACQAENDVGGDAQAFTLRYVRYGLKRVATIMIPQTVITLTGVSSQINLRASGGGALPLSLSPTNEFIHSDFMDGYTIPSNFRFAFTPSFSTIEIKKNDATNFGVGAHTIPPIAITYLIKDFTA